MSTEENERLPNILLVVWDACRYDYTLEHAPFLRELASSNIWFENAIASSPWSLPSHASIITGEPPHEHGRGGFTDSIDTPLVRELSDRGYTNYGFSANGFASQRTGFHEDFDEFRYTGGRDKFVDGIDVSGYSQNLLRDDEVSIQDVLLKVFRRIPRHNHPIKSLINLFTVGCGELATKFESLQFVPHPLFAPTSDYSYDPQKNTRLIRSTLREQDRGDPFFLFTNYMDTHRCYKPDSDLQKELLGRTVEYSELVRLNEEVAAPWEFETKKARRELDETDVEAVRQLYAGEVRTADRHLGRIYETLEEQELLDETLMIVTADHGENLGETDEMGRRRMGHEASASEAVLRVPLLVAHPELDAADVASEVSLDVLYDLCMVVADAGSVGSLDVESLTAGPAASQYPATGGRDDTVEKYPDIQEEAVEYRSVEDVAVVYDDGWKVVAESTGDRWAFDAGQRVDPGAAPEELRSLAAAHLEALTGAARAEPSEAEMSRLEALGYL